MVEEIRGKNIIRKCYTQPQIYDIGGPVLNVVGASVVGCANGTGGTKGCCTGSGGSNTNCETGSSVRTTCSSGSNVGASAGCGTGGTVLKIGKCCSGADATGCVPGGIPT